ERRRSTRGRCKACAARVTSTVVPHEQSHRGKHPEDDRLFGADVLPKLKLAAEEVAWLAGRGYPLKTAIDVVGGHHQLEMRQRTALLRGVCTEAQYRRRAAREAWAEDVARKSLVIDGFNLIISIEVALSGGLVLGCLDGAIRDI